MIVEEESPAIVARLTEAGLILIPAANNAVRFLPPLNVSEAEIDEALAIVAKQLSRNS
jgi:acetylornithine/succinyldiaminopimelate/putrescine aminotransferase